jgi:hypothetical protein
MHRSMRPPISWPRGKRRTKDAADDRFLAPQADCPSRCGGGRKVRPGFLTFPFWRLESRYVFTAHTKYRPGARDLPAGTPPLQIRAGKSQGPAANQPSCGLKSALRSLGQRPQQTHTKTARTRTLESCATAQRSLSRLRIRGAFQRRNGRPLRSDRDGRCARCVLPVSRSVDTPPDR